MGKPKKIMVALPTPDDPELAARLKLRIPGRIGEHYWTCKPTAEDPGDRAVIRALQRGDIVVVEDKAPPAAPTKLSKEARNG